MNASTITPRVHLNTLSESDKKKLAKETYAKKSYFQDVFKHDHLELECQKFSLSFRNEIQRILIEKNLVQDQVPLENLHEILSDEMKAYNFDDGVNKISTYFYETDDSFMAVYHQYIKFLRENFIREPFWFQKTATIRIHCPDAKNSHHYPRYHTDISYGHPPEEFNIWLPLTQLLTGHGFKTMSVPLSKSILEKFDYDYPKFIGAAIHERLFLSTCDALATPVSTAFGKMLAFDSRCIHTGMPLSAHTRVSIDMRILPLSQYDRMHYEYQGLGRRKILFTPGHCYHEQHSDYFLNTIGK